MELAGDVLRAERLRRGLRLEDVSAKTKIGLHLLQAIEANRFELLPSGLFQRSFLRQYARALNVKEEQILASFDEQFKEASLPLPPPLPKSSNPKMRFLFTCGWFAVSISLCGAAFGLWQNVRASLQEPSAKLRRLPTRSDARFQSIGSRLPSREEPIQPLQATSVAGPRAGVHAVFTAKEPVWVSVQSDGSQVFDGTLGGNQTKEMNAATKIVALVGNAAGLNISLNGKDIGPLGQHGEVRVLELTPAGAHAAPRRSTNPATTSEDSKEENVSQQF